MSDDGDSNKPVIDDNNYNVSIDGNLVHHTIKQDDFKITVTIEATHAEEDSKKEEAKGGEKDE